MAVESEIDPGHNMRATLDTSRLAPRKRTRTGCINCSRRRRKCNYLLPSCCSKVNWIIKLTVPGDEAKPVCSGCRRRGDTCEWRRLGSFREANLKVLEPEHPSMNQTASRACRQSKFKVHYSRPGRSTKEYSTDGSRS